MGFDSTVIVLEDNFDNVRKAITGAVLMRGAKAGGHVIEGHAKVNASSGRPGLEVQTGALVNSINVEESKQSATYAEVNVGPSVVYARIHEYGGVIVQRRGEKDITIVIPARPYMRPAVDNNEDDIETAVGTEIRRNLDAAV